MNQQIQASPKTDAASASNSVQFTGTCSHLEPSGLASTRLETTPLMVSESLRELFALAESQQHEAKAARSLLIALDNPHVEAISMAEMTCLPYPAATAARHLFNFAVATRIDTSLMFSAQQSERISQYIAQELTA